MSGTTKGILTTSEVLGPRIEGVTVKGRHPLRASVVNGCKGPRPRRRGGTSSGWTDDDRQDHSEVHPSAVRTDPLTVGGGSDVRVSRPRDLASSVKDVNHG